MSMSANDNTALAGLLAFLGNLERVEMIERLQGDPALRALSASTNRYDIDIPGLVGALRDFQTGGVQYVLSARRVLVADQMRLGKTPTAIASLLAADTFPALVVCPPNLRESWVRDGFGKFAPGLRVARLDGTKPTNLPLADVYVIGDATLAAWEPKLLTAGLRAVVIDEGHRMKEAKAKRSAAAVRIAKTVDRHTGLRLVLTGTPVVNRPKELLNQLDILGRVEELFGTGKDFLERFCGPEVIWTGPEYIDAKGKKRGGYQTVYQGATNLEELNEILTGTCMVRRLRKQVFTQLPEQRLDVVLDINGNLKNYRRAEDDFIRFVFEEKGEKAAAAARRAEVIARMTELRKLLATAKLDAVVDYVENMVAQDEQVVVFGWHREPLQELADKLGVTPIIGGVRNPQAIVDAFQAGETKVIVGNIDSMGTGFTMDQGANIVFIEQAWTPGQMEQAESRCSSLFQTRQVFFHYLLVLDTIDEVLRDVLAEKRAIAGTIVDGQVDSVVTADIQAEVIMRMLARKAS